MTYPILNFENKTKLISSFLILIFIVSSFYLIFLPQPASAGLASQIAKAIFKPIAQLLSMFVTDVVLPLIQGIITPLIDVVFGVLTLPFQSLEELCEDVPPGQQCPDPLAIGLLAVGWLAGLGALANVFFWLPGVKDLDKGIAGFLVGFVIDFVLNKFTGDIIEWIKGGGTPRFVTNWDSFSKDIGNQAGGYLLSQTSGIDICSPFKANLQLSLAEVPEFKTRVKCTLTDIVYSGFLSDFTSGGWVNWLEVNTNDQNNPFAAFLITQDEKNKRTGEQQTAAQNQVVSGKGYLGVSKCVNGEGKDVTAEVSGGSRPLTTEQIAEAGYTCTTDNRGVRKCVDLTGENDVTTQVQTGGGSNPPMDAEQIKELGYKCETNTPGDLVANFATETATAGVKKLYNISADLFGGHAGSTDFAAKLVPFIKAITDAAFNQTIKVGLSGIQKEVSQFAAAADTGVPAGLSENIEATKAVAEIDPNIRSAQLILASLDTFASALRGDEEGAGLIPKINENINILTEIKDLQEKTLPDMVANLIYDSDNSRDTIKLESGGPDTSCTIPQKITVFGVPEKKHFTPTEIGLAVVDKTGTTYTLNSSVAKIQPDFEEALRNKGQVETQLIAASDYNTKTLINDFIAAANIYRVDVLTLIGPAGNTEKKGESKKKYDELLDQVIAKIRQITNIDTTEKLSLSQLSAKLQFLLETGNLPDVSDCSKLDCTINMQIVEQERLITANKSIKTQLITDPARTLSDLVCH